MSAWRGVAALRGPARSQDFELISRNSRWIFDIITYPYQIKSGLICAGNTPQSLTTFTALKRSVVPMARPILPQADLSGHTFGRWRVVASRGRNAQGRYVWECVCECGAVSLKRRDQMKCPNSLSCGCLSSENSRKRFRTHGVSYSNTYRIWVGMRHRCLDPKHHNYANYGGRGITICERWGDVRNFIEDMGERPSKTHSLERIDNDGPYSPENCRWATVIEQHSNTRRNRLLEFQGETKTQAEWARVFGIRPGLIGGRLKSGWPIHEAIASPPGAKR